jgi:hypothetical protein
MFGTDFAEKCIIVQFLGRKKKTGKALNAELAEKIGRDPGVKMRRRIFFKSTNLIGSFQDDEQNTDGATPGDLKVAPTIFPLSHLFAHTCIRGTL